MSQYTESFNLALQWLWGDGFLSPGGADEVAEMLRTVHVTDLDVLDVGCGLGAAALLLVETHGAASVHGVDVEAHLIEQAAARADAAGLSDVVSFELIEPGPLAVEDSRFDVVFTKDAIVHIPDKAAFYAEVIRVLKPGGFFVGSDWLRGDDSTFTARAQQWLEVVHLNFQMQTIDELETALVTAGFSDVSLNDRNEWYQGEITHELAAVSGDRYDQLVEMIGAEDAAYRRESSQRKQEAIADGFLRPTHFVGVAPR